MPLQRIITNAIENNAVDSTKIADNAVGIDQLSVSSDGNAGEFLQTNGAGILSFATAASTLTGGTSFQGISVFRDLFGGSGSFSQQDNVEQTYTVSAGVQSILYFITAAGDSGTSGTNNNGQTGATILGHHDVSNIASLQLRVGTGGIVTGSVSNLPQTGPGFSSYLGDLVIAGNVTDTTSTEATGSIATAFQGSGAGAGNGGDLLIPGVRGNSFWPGFGEGGNGGAPNIVQCGSGGGSFSVQQPGSVGQSGLIIILEFA